MTTGKPWTLAERSEAAMIYAAMLHAEKNGIPFNKAACRRGTLPRLDGRSAGSYEMKMCNISAALADMGRDWIKGYKPLKGYQRDLKISITVSIDTMSINTKCMWLDNAQQAGSLKK